jgi:amino acid transporter
MIAGGLASTMGTYNAYLGTTSSALRAQAEEGVAPSIFNAFPQYKCTAPTHTLSSARS